MASLIRYPDCRYWIAAFRDSRGRQIRRSTREVDKRRAQRTADILERAAKRQGNPQSIRQAFAEFCRDQFGEELHSALLRDYAQRWLAGRKAEVSHSTQVRYEKIVGKFLSFLGSRAACDLSEIKKAEIVEFRNAQAKTFSIATATLELKTVKMLFRQARLEGYLFVDPAEGINPLKDRDHDKVKRRPFTLEELQAILSSADPEWQSLIMFGLYTGQRLGDLATLRWSQVDLERNQIRFVTRKTGKSLLVPIAAPLAKHLEQIAGQDDPRAPVHPKASKVVQAQNGRVVSLSNQFGEILVAAGLSKPRYEGKSHLSRGIGRNAKREGTDISFHSLRHTAVSLLKDAGVPDSVVMALVGHDTVAMSQRYTHVGKEALENAASKMPDLAAKPQPLQPFPSPQDRPPAEFSTLKFRIAKTMPDTPHEYVVRTSENETEYAALFNTIAEQGQWETFMGRKYKYWSPGDGFKYWRMSNDLENSQVINRAKVA